MDILNTFQRFVGDAAVNLGVTSGFRTSTTEVVDWEENKNPPSDDALNAEIDRLKNEYDANQYQRNRKAEYDALNQLEMQFDDKEDGTTTWEDAINAIKAKYPKG